jgi:hypothetical protein
MSPATRAAITHCTGALPRAPSLMTRAQEMSTLAAQFVFDTASKMRSMPHDAETAFLLASSADTQLSHKSTALIPSITCLFVTMQTHAYKTETVMMCHLLGYMAASHSVRIQTKLVATRLGSSQLATCQLLLAPILSPCRKACAIRSRSLLPAPRATVPMSEYRVAQRGPAAQHGLAQPSDRQVSFRFTTSRHHSGTLLLLYLTEQHIMPV